MGRPCLRERDTFRDMAIGFMEVQLVKAKSLHYADIFGKMDPYVLIQYNGQEQSSVAIEYPGLSNQHKLIFKIMEKDLYGNYFFGQAM
ncbi:Elicitor-responsive protein 1, partial [Mucuna pruriens]